MEVIQRYLHAIEFWLPNNQKKDIIAEISEDLHSQIEEKQNQLGRALNDGELDALLKQRGNPLLVANRYLPPRTLIGPALFPLYVFVLKIWAICWPLPGIVLFILVRRTQHPELPWTNTIGAAGSWLWTAVFLAAGTITLAFAVLEMVEAKTHFLENWNPRKLPALRDPNKIPRLSSALELVFHSVFIALFIVYAPSVNLLSGPAISITLSSKWHYFFWAFIVSGLLTAALSGANLLRPYWTPFRAACRMAVDGVSGTLWCWLLKVDIVDKMSLTDASAHRTAEITNAVNNWIGRSFPYSVVVVMIILGVDLYRIFRLTRKTTPAPNPETLMAVPM